MAKKTRKTTKGGKVLFRLTNEALIVANSGAPFSREGVIAVCHMRLSEKSGQPKDIYDSDDLIGSIAAKKIAKYRSDVNELLQDAGLEKELAKDQQHRFIWELLQNADDAIISGNKNSASQALIGAKGLGFRSVLAISNSPEIYSDKFNFRFSPEETQKVLEDNGISGHEDIPALRIPHKCEPDAECASLLNTIKKEYTTVIRLPFEGNNEKRIQAHKYLEELDETCLLFCQNLSQIEIQLKDESPDILKIERNGVCGFNNGKSDFTLHGKEGKRTWRRWSAIWKSNDKAEKQLTAALCLPVENQNGGNVECLERERSVYVFFPTASDDKVSGVRALIHASYDLSANREHLRDEQKYGDELRKKIGELVSTILIDIPPATALRAFGEVTFDEENNNPETENKHLQKIIGDTIRNTPFIPVIGGEKVCPAEVQIWEHGLGQIVKADDAEVQAARLLCPHLNNEEVVCGILRKLDETNDFDLDLLDHAKLMKKCKNESLEECFVAWKTAENIAEEGGDYIIGDLKNAPLWWVYSKRGGFARSLNDSTPLLYKRPRTWPKWLKVDALALEFRKAIESDKHSEAENGQAQYQHSMEKHDAWPLNRKSSFFRYALLPFCVDKKPTWWNVHGWDVLQWTFTWKSDIAIPQPMVIGRDDERNEAGRIIFVPTNKKWLPAVNCYAGKEWDAPAGFNEYFKNKKDRGVLTSLKNWKLEANTKDNKELWGNVLRWLGVSWEPKLLLFEYDRSNPQTNVPSNYIDECLKQAKVHHVSAHRIDRVKSICLEYFPASLAGCHPTKVFRMIRDIKQVIDRFISQRQSNLSGAVHTLVKYTHQQSADMLYRPPQSVLLALFQLQREAWVPCSSGLRYPNDRKNDLVMASPIDAFMPECRDLRGIVPVIHRPSGIPDDEWGNIYELLKNLCVGTKIPNSVDDKAWWEDFMTELAEKSRKSGEGWREGHGDWAKAVRRFYKAYNASLSGMGAAPYLKKTDDGEFVAFAPSCEIRWADKDYYAKSPVRSALLEHEFKVFPLFLDEGSKFGLAPLSESIDKSPDPNESGSVTSEILSRLDHRKKMLALAVGRQEDDFSFSEKIRGCESLHLILKNEHATIIAEPEVDFDISEEILYVNSGSVWRAFSMGIAEMLGLSSSAASVLEGLLGEYSDEECRKRLRYLGKSDAEIDAVDDVDTFDDTGPNALIPPSTDHPIGDEVSMMPTNANVGSTNDTQDNRKQPASAENDKSQLAQNRRPKHKGSKNPANTTNGRGGGSGGDIDKNKRIGDEAVKVVIKYYEGKKCKVDNVGAEKKGWDLEIWWDGQVIFYVEVKGTDSDRINVTLSDNEYEKSRDKQYCDQYRLAVVRNALGSIPTCVVYKKRGAEWDRVCGDDTNAPERLKTEERKIERTEAIIREID